MEAIPIAGFYFDKEIAMHFCIVNFTYYLSLFDLSNTLILASDLVVICTGWIKEQLTMKTMIRCAHS